MGPRKGFRAATEECQGLTPQDQPFATNLAMTGQLVFRKRGSRGCEPQGACMTPMVPVPLCFIAHFSLFIVNSWLIHKYSFWTELEDKAGVPFVHHCPF